MADIADRAQVLEESQRAAALQQARALQRERPLLISGVLCCIECEETLSQARINTNPDHPPARCVGCQSYFEMEVAGRGA